ncbi:unnamed protein product [Blepharisma stoltei]|uniref:Transmembrane protein 138 n=1 Tax=Blepharisma stoltei TaxID=1481888 RepID=A0AAU9KCZ9_9CILI|nr:unnamed protein product [Blepharisma stoltei]
MARAELVEARSFGAKLMFFYFLLLCDVITNAYTYYGECAIPGQEDYTSGTENIIVLIFFGIQGGIQVLIICWLFFLVWQTFLFRFGLIGILCREFLSIFLAFPVHLILFGLEKGLRLEIVMNETTVINLWSHPGYEIVYWVRSIFMVFFYVLLIEKTLTLGSPQYYKPHKWLVM